MNTKGCLPSSVCPNASRAAELSDIQSYLQGDLMTFRRQNSKAPNLLTGGKIISMLAEE